MQYFLMAFYILFFATGFMGGAALILMKMRMRSRLLIPLLIFQILFLFGVGLIIMIYFIQNLPDGLNSPAARIILFLATGANTALWSVAIILIKQVSPPGTRLKGFPAVAAALALFVIIKSIANMVLVMNSQSGAAGIESLTGIAVWNISGHVLTGLAMAAFGLMIRGPLNPEEPPAVRLLMKSYGLCALIFAPVGLLEALIQMSDIWWLSTISLEHFFYLSWNIASMSAAVRLFKLSPKGQPLTEVIPKERILSLGLSAREVDIVVLVGQGLSNQKIAEELFISPATVRTHIYNIYKKVEVGSRVELLNKLRTIT